MKFDSFSDLVETWGRQHMVDDLGETKDIVRGWFRNNNIPSDRWQKLLDKAPKRGIKISPETLIELAARD